MNATLPSAVAWTDSAAQILSAGRLAAVALRFLGLSGMQNAIAQQAASIPPIRARMRAGTAILSRLAYSGVHFVTQAL